MDLVEAVPTEATLFAEVCGPTLDGLVGPEYRGSRRAPFVVGLRSMDKSELDHRSIISLSLLEELSKLVLLSDSICLLDPFDASL
mmetsp:Transcript_16742/g.25625  ORF Transcript_16742/g.25625 Transcript_16742/m.25625 type:complete len:85 (-) Transcript_16742:524-778(-)